MHPRLHRIRAVQRLAAMAQAQPLASALPELLLARVHPVPNILLVLRSGRRCLPARYFGDGFHRGRGWLDCRSSSSLLTLLAQIREMENPHHARVRHGIELRLGDAVADGRLVHLGLQLG